MGFILIFCLLIQSSTGSKKGALKNASFNSVLRDKIPQSVDQTFNINNWGLGKIEQKLLTDIKAQIDSLAKKGIYMNYALVSNYWGLDNVISFRASNFLYINPFLGLKTVFVTF